MTTTEIFKQLASHLIQGVMFHDEMSNYYDFLGLPGYRKCHEYHLMEEFNTYRKLCKYYVERFNKMIEPNEFSGTNIVIPQNWYKYTRQDVDVATKRDAVKNGLEAWVKWENDTRTKYQSMYTELINIDEIDAAMFVKNLISDVSKEIKEAQLYHLNKKATDYNMINIIEQQKRMHGKYKQKIRYCLS